MECSVIITSKNRPKLAIEAIHSVLDQTFKATEIILIDDGSEVSYEWLRNNFNGQIIYHKNITSVGGAKSRNIGAKMAKGNILMFLDDDDLWLKEKIKCQLNLFKNKPESQVIFSGRCLVDISNRKKVLRRTKHQTNYSMQKVLIFKNNFIGVTSGVAIKRDFFEKIDGFDEKLPCRQDYDLWIRSCLNNCNAIWDGQHNVIYSLHGIRGKQISNKGDYQKIALEIILNKYQSQIRELNSSDYKQCMAEKFFSIAKAYRNENFLKKLYFSYMSFIHYPKTKTLLLGIAPKELLLWIGL